MLRVWGGREHVGAVAVSVPPAGPGGEPYAALAVVPGHAEGPLAEEGAALLSAASGRACVAVVGIHIDRASRAEIDAAVRHARLGFQRLVARLVAARDREDT